MELTPTNKDFACTVPGTPGDCFIVDDHNPTNGEALQYSSTLKFWLHGTGTLAGFDRIVIISNVLNVVSNQARLPGSPVQSFDANLLQMQGQLPPGDPDFDLLRVTAGTDFGLPSPGHTTLTQQPGGNWAVDSFFDITYSIDFVGAPGGHVAGMSGSTTATIRMNLASGCSVPGVELLDANSTPTGVWLLQTTLTPAPARPRLEAELLPNGKLRICWPDPSPCYALQHKLTLNPAESWENLRVTPQATNGNLCVTLDITESAEYFRLSQ
jgi:hypothetical protein